MFPSPEAEGHTTIRTNDAAKKLVARLSAPRTRQPGERTSGLAKGSATNQALIPDCYRSPQDVAPCTTPVHPCDRPAVGRFGSTRHWRGDGRRASVVVVFLSGVQSVWLGRSPDIGPSSGRRDLKPHSISDTAFVECAWSSLYYLLREVRSTTRGLEEMTAEDNEREESRLQRLKRKAVVEQWERRFGQICQALVVVLICVLLAGSIIGSPTAVAVSIFIAVWVIYLGLYLYSATLILLLAFVAYHRIRRLGYFPNAAAMLAVSVVIVAIVVPIGTALFLPATNIFWGQGEILICVGGDCDPGTRVRNSSAQAA